MAQESDKIPRLDGNKVQYNLKHYPRILISYDIGDGKTRKEVTNCILYYAVDNAVIDDTSTETAYTIFIDENDFVLLKDDLLAITNDPNFIFDSLDINDPDKLIITPVLSIHILLPKRYWYQFYVDYSINISQNAWIRL